MAGIFPKINKHTRPNKCTGREFLQKLINAQVQINAQGINKTKMTHKVKKTAQGKFSLKINKRTVPNKLAQARFFLKNNKNAQCVYLAGQST